MIKKHCVHCATTTLHNPMKKAGEFRCVVCGHPVSTNQAKKPQQELLRDKLSLRKRLMS